MSRTTRALWVGGVSAAIATAFIYGPIGDPKGDVSPEGAVLEVATGSSISAPNVETIAPDAPPPTASIQNANLDDGASDATAPGQALRLDVEPEPEPQPTAIAPAADSLTGNTEPEAVETAAKTLTDSVPSSSGTTEDGQARRATPLASTPPTPTDPDMPAVDLIRVETDGAAILAGKGQALADVSVLLDGQEIGQARADAEGNFVAFFDVPVNGPPRRLSLDTTGPDGTRRQVSESVIVAPTAQANDVAEPAVTPTRQDEVTENATVTASGPVEPARPTAPVTGSPPVNEGAQAMARGNGVDPTELGDTPTTEAAEAAVRRLADTGANTAVPTGESPDTPATAAQSPRVASVTPSASEAPAAPRIFRVTPSGLRLEGASDAPPQVTEDLGIDAIAYDDQGGVQLTGRGDSDTDLRVYVDGREVRSIDVGTDGVWATPLPEIGEGVYTLRIDAVDRSGTVVGRVETPFARTAPEDAAAARAEGRRAITVQPGYTLWALSEGYFGDGLQYVQIFEANRDRIRDPDLIFPGQIFALPGVQDAAQR